MIFSKLPNFNHLQVVKITLITLTSLIGFDKKVLILEILGFF